MLFAFLACFSPSPPDDASAVPSPAPPLEPTARHAVVIVIDTLRADAIDKSQTPNLDAIAARGDAVARAWASGTWTVPSVTALMTGMPVRQHGWDLPTGRIGRYPQLPQAPMLQSVLQDAGFGTFGIYTNPYLAEGLGFDRGFDVWKRTMDPALPRLFKEHVDRTWGDGRRHYAYVHLLGPHSPLKPSEDAQKRWSVTADWFEGRLGLSIGAAKRGQREGVSAAYRAGYYAVVEDTDALVGEVIAALGEHREETLIVVTSDHGEMLGEHGKFGHGRMVHEPLTHVPLMIDRGALPETLNITSVPAIVTGALGIQHTWPTAADASLPLVSQREGQIAFSPDGITKGIWQTDTPTVYDLVADPGEQTPLSDRASDIQAAKEAWEAAVPAGITGEDAVQLSPETLEALKTLGYIE